MKLLTLVAILVLIFVGYLIFYKTLDFFTPSPYVLSWIAPSNNGGDPNCCGYDWQICSDEKCTNVVDSGTTKSTSVETTKLSWATTYTVQVRATNISGPGEWTSASLTTGDGTVSSIVIGSKISSAGVIQTPLSAGPSQNIAVWTSLSKGSVSPNTLQGYAQLTITRGGVAQPPLVIQLSSKVLGEIDIFQGDLISANWSSVVLNQGDTVTADISIFTSTNEIVTEATASTTVTTTVPGNVTGLSLVYSATPPPLASNESAIVSQGLEYVKADQFPSLSAMIATLSNQKPSPWIVSQISANEITGLRLMLLFLIANQQIKFTSLTDGLDAWLTNKLINSRQLVAACNDLVSGQTTSIFALLNSTQQAQIKSWIQTPP